VVFFDINTGAGLDVKASPVFHTITKAITMLVYLIAFELDTYQTTEQAYYSYFPIEDTTPPLGSDPADWYNEWWDVSTENDGCHCDADGFFEEETDYTRRQNVISHIPLDLRTLFG
jgi:hypothetical protein